MLADGIFTAAHKGSFWAASLAYSPLHIFWAGSEAVLLFFILSGFVLARPFFTASPPRIDAFLIRRVCRIYLPYICALMLVMVARICVSVPPNSHLTNVDWSRPITPEILVGYFAMSGFDQDLFFNPPLWSLAHEMRISLIFPLLIAMTTRLGVPGRIAAFGCITIICSTLLTGLPALTDSTPISLNILNSILRTGYFAWFFVLGIELARYQTRLIEYVRLLGRAGKALLLVMAVLLYCAEWEVPALHYHYAIGDAAVGLGGALFILVILASAKLQRLLSTGPIHFLGRSSYSLYITHSVVIPLTFYALYLQLNGIFLFILSIAFAVAFAGVMYHLVERPSIQLGYLFSRKVREQLSTLSAKAVD